MVTEVMKETTNWRVWDQIRVISLGDVQAGEVSWEADSRDRCRVSERIMPRGYASLGAIPLIPV